MNLVQEIIMSNGIKVGDYVISTIAGDKAIYKVRDISSITAIQLTRWLYPSSHTVATLELVYGISRLINKDVYTVSINSLVKLTPDKAAVIASRLTDLASQLRIYGNLNG